MSLVNKLKNRFRNTQQKGLLSNPFFPFFMRLEGESEFPFVLALNTLEHLEETVSTDRELMECLLEDIIFSSIYATFYEQLFVTMKENPEHAVALIDKFSEGAHQREQVIATQTQLHFDYIKNNGICAGCECCENHPDVDELIPPHQKMQLDFFIKLYLGMQSIQFSMEHLLYDILPHRQDLFEHLTEKNVLGFRQAIIDYTENKLDAATNDAK